MKRNLSILYLCCLSIVLAPAQGLKAANFTVPFQNIPLSRGETITADYSFGPHAIIFCFDNTLTADPIISWTFKGSRSGNMPIFLKTKSNFEGEFADPNGTITIFNNNNRNLVINCLFGY